jgi:hypothetical protein
MELLPMYGYCWTKHEHYLHMVTSEEEKEEILKDMRDEGAIDEYTWFKLTKMEVK